MPSSGVDQPLRGPGPGATYQTRAPAPPRGPATAVETDTPSGPQTPGQSSQSAAPKTTARWRSTRYKTVPQAPGNPSSRYASARNPSSGYKTTGYASPRHKASR